MTWVTGRLTTVVGIGTTGTIASGTTTTADTHLDLVMRMTPGRVAVGTTVMTRAMCHQEVTSSNALALVVTCLHHLLPQGAMGVVQVTAPLMAQATLGVLTCTKIVGCSHPLRLHGGSSQQSQKKMMTLSVVHLRQSCSELRQIWRGASRRSGANLLLARGEAL